MVADHGQRVSQNASSFGVKIGVQPNMRARRKSRLRVLSLRFGGNNLVDHFCLV
jgi:hypothetical protein